MNNFYEGVEDLGLFTKPHLLEAYRKMLLEKTQRQVEFIRNHVADGRKINVYELGCGNGRLLIALHEAGLLSYGTGLDGAVSRIRFAAKWARDLSIKDVRFAKSDILEEDPLYRYSLLVAMTGLCNYFNNFDLQFVLNRYRTTGRKALFELYKPHTTLAKTWFKLPPEDPFLYYLNEYIPIDGDDVVRHNKTFIGQDGKIDERSEVLHYYSMGEFMDMCLEAGYKKFLWAVEDATKFVVLVE